MAQSILPGNGQVWGEFPQVVRLWTMSCRRRRSPAIRRSPRGLQQLGAPPGSGARAHLATKAGAAGVSSQAARGAGRAVPGRSAARAGRCRRRAADADRDPALLVDRHEPGLVGHVVAGENGNRPANGASSRKAAIALPLSMPGGGARRPSCRAAAPARRALGHRGLGRRATQRRGRRRLAVVQREGPAFLSSSSTPSWAAANVARRKRARSSAAGPGVARSTLRPRLRRSRPCRPAARRRSARTADRSDRSVRPLARASAPRRSRPAIARGFPKRRAKKKKKDLRARRDDLEQECRRYPRLRGEGGEARCPAASAGGPALVGVGGHEGHLNMRNLPSPTGFKVATGLIVRLRLSRQGVRGAAASPIPAGPACGRSCAQAHHRLLTECRSTRSSIMVQPPDNVLLGRPQRARGAWRRCRPFL